MKAWQPWFGLASGAGLLAMLVGEGWVDGVGFAVAAAPLLLGLGAWLRHRGRGSDRG